nr:hypothetical protein [uncultured Albidiferax sp.]
MARTKNYKTSEGRAKQVAKTWAKCDIPLPSVDDAYIDMEKLLGPGARFVDGTRVLDLRPWLGRGIDTWVCTSGFCLRMMLLSGSRETSTVTTYFRHLPDLFNYMIDGEGSHATPRAQTPADLLPKHILHFVGWLQRRAQAQGWGIDATRNSYQRVKAVLLEMFTQGFIRGEPIRFFPINQLPWRSAGSRQTSLSDAEQERFAKAVKSDLIDVHLGRSMLSQGKVQALRLLLVAHRQGKNRTPLLEMRRDALSPGLIPGTIRMRTLKHRNKKVRASVGRAAQIEPNNILSDVQPEEEDILFNLAEGAVLQQAIASSRALVSEAPAAFKQRIWLYRVERTSFSTRKGSVACLNVKFLQNTIDNLVQRHNLQGDDGQPMRLNLSRLRKSFFDRALRVADGDMAITANLMGNTPGVAETHYPSMNEARKAEAAGFMNEEYTALMRANAQPEQTPQPQPVQVHPFKSKKGQERSTLPVPTPVASCIDSIHGHHAPRDGRSHCDKFVMCLFCPSFVIVGTIEELWRLFSFQVFAKAELEYLDENLGAERTADAHLEDLRDRYRVAIPYIDDFTRRQFAQSRVAMARAKTASALHSFWQHQMTLSRRARNKTPAHGLGPTATQGNYRGENHLGF